MADIGERAHDFVKNQIDVKGNRGKKQRAPRSQKTRLSDQGAEFRSAAERRRQGALTPDIEAIQTAQKKDRDPHNFINEDSLEEMDANQLDAEIKKYLSESEEEKKSESSINDSEGHQGRIEQIVMSVRDRHQLEKKRRQKERKAQRELADLPPSGGKNKAMPSKKKVDEKTTKDGKDKEEKKDGEEEEEEVHSSDESRDERNRIAAIKEAILREEKKRLKKLIHHFKNKPDEDISKGRCCCKYPNEKGAHIIHIVDILFVANFFRWIFAIWAKVDDHKISIYTRVRWCTFWLFWLILYAIVIGTSIQKAIDETESNASIYINSFIYLSILMLGTIIDFHWCQVMKYHAKIHQKKLEREAKEREKREKAAERYKQQAQLNLNADEEMPASKHDGSQNPVYVPRRQREAEDYEKMRRRQQKPIKDIKGKRLPGGLEAPGHWRADLERQFAEDYSSNKQEAKLKKKKRKGSENPRNKNKIVNLEDY